jgi:hypothetical protein
VRIAIIDSGAAAMTHKDLTGIVRAGFDVVNKSPQGWEQDTVFHGTHCAGVIAGNQNNTGIRGFAPDAEVFALKIFPGGMFSTLVSALDWCMDQNIDLVNLSLGSSDPSEIVEARIAKAKQMGIACIVAAGNSGGPVQYPASSKNVLSVAAIGKLGEFPTDSYHTQTMMDGSQGQYFSAKFTCFGPEIGVCAPGVAILSSVPPDNYAAWDGTSMAAPHVTGLAALILAHHDDFKNAYKARSAARVERLFDIIRASAQAVGIADRSRVGAGMPDAVRALNLQPAVATAGAGIGAMSSDEMLRQLMAAMQGLGPMPVVTAPMALNALRDRMQQAGILGVIGAAQGIGGQAQPQAFMPQGFMPQGFAPQGFAPQGFAPQGFAPQGFAPQGFMPQGFTPQANGPYMPQQPDPRAAMDRLRTSMQQSNLL